MRLASVRLLAVAGTLVLAACSSYDARWREARAATHPDRYTGAWEGRWTSTRHPGEGGRLHCIIAPMGHEGSGDYLAEFHAQWREIFSSTQKIVLHRQPSTGLAAAKESDTGVPPVRSAAKAPGLLAQGQLKPVGGLTRAFHGSAQLSTLVGGGTYDCQGSMTPHTLQAHYEARYDGGEFRLTK